jgi:hypothetical protein
MSDGYLAYRHLGNRLRCWAHLLRKVQGLTESTDARVVRAGKAMQDVLCTLMEAIYLARATPDHENGTLASQYTIEITRLRTLCEQHRGDSHGKLRHAPTTSQSPGTAREEIQRFASMRDVWHALPQSVARIRLRVFP